MTEERKAEIKSASEWSVNEHWLYLRESIVDLRRCHWVHRGDTLNMFLRELSVPSCVRSVDLNAMRQ